MNSLGGIGGIESAELRVLSSLRNHFMDKPLIQVFKPSLGQEELDALAEVFASGWIGLGPKTASFESAFAQFVQAPFAVGVNSATAALHLACHALGTGPETEVIVPPISFVSTAHAPLYCGAKVVFADVEEGTLNLDPDRFAAAITPATRAVIVVHYGGHPAQMDKIWEIARQHQLAVIEDASHAAGSKYRGVPVGGLTGTDATCFSFQAVKNLAVGDGGMLTTERPELVSVFQRLRWLGIDKSTWDRTEAITQDQESGTRRFASYGWYYEVHELGFKCHLNDIAAAIGLVQLRKLPAANRRRQEIAEQYTAAFSRLGWITCPSVAADCESSWHNYVIRTAHRDELNLYLKECAIATGVHYLPLHLHPYYRRLNHASMPVAEAQWTRLLSLPIYPDLTADDQQRVIEAVRAFGQRKGL